MESVTTEGTTEDHTSNSANELTQVGSSTLTYDANGNVTTDDHGQTLIYDAWNHLIQVRDSDSSIIKTYTYDGTGRRIAEINAANTRTDLYYTGHQLIEERQGNIMTLQNVYSPRYQNAILLRDSGGERLYFSHDANYNVTAVYTSTGQIVQRMVYDAGGLVTFLNPDGSAGSNIKNIATLYQGMHLDASIGWYFTDTRAYSPTMMVWNRPDEAGYIDGVNMYQFVGGNPVNSVDPWGTIDWTTNVPQRPDSSLSLSEVQQLGSIAHDRWQQNQGEILMAGLDSDGMPIIGSDPISAGVRAARLTFPIKSGRVGSD